MNKITNFTFDIDDVVFDTTPRVAKMVCRNLGIKYIRPYDWAFDAYAKIDPRIPGEIMRVIDSDALFKGRPCHQDIPYALNKLLANPRLTVNFVSARKPEQLDATMDQFGKHGIMAKESQVHCLGWSVPKIETLQKCGTQMHYDDAAHNIEECITHGIPATLISNGQLLYNHHMRGKIPHYINLVRALRAQKII